MRLCWLVLLSTFAMGLHGPCWAADSLAPAVSGLRSAQARLVQGDPTAIVADRTQLRTLAHEIAAASQDSWRDPKQITYATIYLLSGGPPGPIARLYERGLLAKNAAPTLRGALAYVLGRRAEAFRLLGPLDPRGVDLRLAGQLAYVKSFLEPRNNRGAALADLELARLLAPGSLVEEASLRREILLSDEIADAGRTAHLSINYMMRFSHSVYFREFLEPLADIVVQRGLADDSGTFEKLREASRFVKEPERADFLLAIARGELIMGKYSATIRSAKEGITAMDPKSREALRGRFYLAAADMLSGGKEPGLAGMKDLDTAELEPRDRALLEAIRRIAQGLDSSTGGAGPTSGPNVTASVKEETALVSKTIAKANAVLAKGFTSSALEPAR